MNMHKVALGLGWFSIGLGLVELFAAKRVARALGMRRQESLIRMFGLREIATGIGVLTMRRKRPWIWGRVAGDVLDLGVLASGLAGRSRRRRATAFATGSVAAVSALDVLCGQRLNGRQ